MMYTGHTPGPWTAHTNHDNDNYVTAGTNDQIPICTTGRVDVQSEHDIALIAAAPAMAVIVEAAGQVLQNLVDVDQYGPEDDGYPRPASLCHTDEQGRIWYLDLWTLKQALAALDT